MIDIANYGAEGCRCGPDATPARGCPLHHIVWQSERVEDALLRAGLDPNRIAIREAAREAVIEELQAASAALPVMNEDEQEAMDHLAAFMKILLERWSLRSNQSEMATAIHTLQGFIVQHMLHRLMPGEWNAWYWNGEDKT